MARHVLDTNVLIRHWRKWGGRTATGKSPEGAAEAADHLIALRQTDAIVTPVRLEFLAGVQSSQELVLARPFLSRFRVADRGNVMPQDWAEALRLAERVPDPEVPAKAQRRKFTAEYKLRIVREAERCKQPGEIGALLRREGLYSSLLTAWRREVEQGARAALRSKKRGPKARVVDPRVKELERENSRLRKRLEQAEIIISVQKKVSKLLGIPLESPDDEKN